MKLTHQDDQMLDRMLAVAKMYYLEKQSQQAIAHKLNISRSWVSKLLTRAEELGMVKIQIVSPFEESQTLERRLKERYGADIHITTHNSDVDVFTDAMGFLTAQLRPYDVVAVGPGTSVSRTISMSGSCFFPDVTVVPLAGNYGNNAAVYSNYNAVRLAENLHSKVQLIDAPALCRTQEEYEILVNNPTTQEALQLANRPDIMLVGMNTREWTSKSRYALFSRRRSKCWPTERPSATLLSTILTNRATRWRSARCSGGSVLT